MDLIHIHQRLIKGRENNGIGKIPLGIYELLRSYDRKLYKYAVNSERTEGYGDASSAASPSNVVTSGTVQKTLTSSFQRTEKAASAKRAEEAKPQKRRLGLLSCYRSHAISIECACQEAEERAREKKLAEEKARELKKSEEVRALKQAEEKPRQSAEPRN
jgi:hypothetical protein